MNEVPASPWDRYGWVMGAVWLVFLGFPIFAVATADEPMWLRAVGLIALAAFAAVYLHGFIRLEPLHNPRGVERLGLLHGAVLAALTAVVCIVGGGEGLGTLPFIVALAMFTMRLALAVATTVVAIAAPIALTATGVFEQGTQFISLITALVATVAGVIRVLEARELEHRTVEHELGIVAERDRVARDVHDVLGHSLTVVATKAELAERLMDVDPERARDELRQIQTLTRNALAEIRATVSGLRVTRLDTELAAARTAFAAAEIDADVPTSGDVVEPRHRLVLAWALREAVTNVVRHSGAHRCEIRLAPDGLSVIDDGRGLDEMVEGNGLIGIRERVERTGGTLVAGPGPDGTGTCVEVRL
jgi:two-component system sensor histidine kinase DesK